MGNSLADESCWIELCAIEGFEYLVCGFDTLRTLTGIACDSGNGFAKLLVIGKGGAFFLDWCFYQSYLLGNKIGEFGAFVVQFKLNSLSYSNAVHCFVGEGDEGFWDFTACGNVTEVLGFNLLPRWFAPVLDCGFAVLCLE